MRTISWFSAGAQSAVATKLEIENIDEIIYIHIADQHQDTTRFLEECQVWFDKKIQILHSPYLSVERACRAAGGQGYLNGPRGAACTNLLKRRVRKEWEASQTEQLTYVWGYTIEEITRAKKIKSALPEQYHSFPLINKFITKTRSHQILAANEIKRPAMYELGYPNNNCIGCVKGGIGYWNKIRVDFPEVFLSRAKLERQIGASCINGIYLDELAPARGRKQKIIVDECGIHCEKLIL